MSTLLRFVVFFCVAVRLGVVGVADEGAELNDTLIEWDHTHSNSSEEVQEEVQVQVQNVEDVKEKAIESFIQIFGLPEGSLSSSGPLSSGPPPEFMLSLYDTITGEGGVTKAHNPFDCDIVRSFGESSLSSPSLPTYFHFNLSSLSSSTEVVEEAELHLWRQGLSSAETPSLLYNPYLVLSLYQVKEPGELRVPELHKLLGVHYVAAYGAGWELFNVKKAVEEWRNGTENHGFLVSAESLGGSRIPIQFARKGHPKAPILVLYNKVEGLETMETVTATAPKARKKVLKPKLEGEEGAEDSFTYEVVTPLSSLESPSFHHSLLFHPSIRHPSSRSRRSKNETTPTTPTSEDASRSAVWGNGSSSSLGAAAAAAPCSLQDNYISFERLGWSSWIISPKGYNARACRGPCLTFPLPPSSTNHATVAAIVHELGGAGGSSSHPSPPCCVPTSLLPISLLYYDEGDNVVLKQYGDMVAGSCGCH